MRKDERVWEFSASRRTGGLSGTRRLFLLGLCRGTLEEDVCLLQEFQPALNLLLAWITLIQDPVGALNSSGRIRVVRSLRSEPGKYTPNDRLMGSDR